MKTITVVAVFITVLFFVGSEAAKVPEPAPKPAASKPAASKPAASKPAPPKPSSPESPKSIKEEAAEKIEIMHDFAKTLPDLFNALLGSKAEALKTGVKTAVGKTKDIVMKGKGLIGDKLAAEKEAH